MHQSLLSDLWPPDDWFLFVVDADVLSLRDSCSVTSEEGSEVVLMLLQLRMEALGHWGRGGIL